MKLIVFCNVPPDCTVDMTPCFIGNSFLFLQDMSEPCGAKMV